MDLALKLILPPIFVYAANYTKISRQYALIV